MGNILIFIGVLVVLILISNLWQNDKKPSGNCKNCPEYRYCGGGRPRCARRSENKKKSTG